MPYPPQLPAVLFAALDSVAGSPRRRPCRAPAKTDFSYRSQTEEACAHDPTGPRTPLPVDPIHEADSIESLDHGKLLPTSSRLSASQSNDFPDLAGSPMDARRRQTTCLRPVQLEDSQHGSRQ